MQPLRLDPGVYRAPTQPEADELVPGHNPVLPIGELGKGPIAANAPLFSYFMVKGVLAAHCPVVCR